MNKALLVGINSYQLPGNNLSGCVNDVLGIKSALLGTYGYQDPDIKVLTDREATKVNIVNALQWLMSSGADHLVFHYSGHGTEFYDAAHHENDQALCPTDAQGISTLLSDKELAAIFATASVGSRLFFVADCCHSGTVDREMIFGMSRSRFIRARSMVIPGLEPSKTLPIKTRGGLSLATHLLLSGCRDDQTSADATFGSVANGALSYGIMNSIRNNPRQSWRQMHSEVVAWLAWNGFSQVPQLSGPEELLGSSLFT